MFIKRSQWTELRNELAELQNQIEALHSKDKPVLEWRVTPRGELPVIVRAQHFHTRVEGGYPMTGFFCGRDAVAVFIGAPLVIEIVEAKAP